MVLTDEAIGAAYLAAPEFTAPLEQELARRGARVSGLHGRLLLSPDPPVRAAWALDVWTAPRLIPIASVKSAADALRAMQRNWVGYAAGHHRRSALITDRLPPLRPRPLHFPEPAPTGHLGAWTLLAPDLLLASPTKTSPFAHGECHFVEDRIGPPSRAYLKFWEACTHLGTHPATGQTVLDLGAAPGGWTWAAAQDGAQVSAIDKAPLADAVAALPNVTPRTGSAFAEPPHPVDWLICDVIAYPARLLTLMRQWIDHAPPGHIVCTLKFQGETDHDTAEAFAAIPGGRVLHLFQNKHELTFLWQRCKAP